jgi:N-acetyl sugar amidotransferase
MKVFDRIEQIKDNKICKRCVMDRSAPKITFNSEGLCCYCQNFDSKIKPVWKNDNSNLKSLKLIAENIKKQQSKEEFDCLIGVSGGVDSSYLTYFATEELKLRPLIIHVDAGWNSKTAVENIEKIIDKLNLELQTEVVFWPEMRDLQLSFFKACVPHIDTPQDHSFFAATYNYAVKNNIKFILNGGNFSTESIREPLEWHYHASDLKHLLDIQKKFGTTKLKRFPLSGLFKYKLYYRYFKGIKVIQPLNYIKYEKKVAKKLLENKFNWLDYSHKHYESRFTKFFEGFWLIKKFGYDKRKAHFSSLINSNQMTRDDALKQLETYPIDTLAIKQDVEFVANKLNISEKELLDLLKKENRSFKDYKSDYFIIDKIIKILNILNIERRIIH